MTAPRNATCCLLFSASNVDAFNLSLALESVFLSGVVFSNASASVAATKQSGAGATSAAGYKHNMQHGAVGSLASRSIETLDRKKSSDVFSLPSSMCRKPLKSSVGFVLESQNVKEERKKKEPRGEEKPLT